AACERARLSQAAAALLRGSAKTDQPRGRLIAAWLAADPAGRAAGFDDYVGAFLTDGQEVRARLATAEALSRLPDLAAILQAEAERLRALGERLRAALLLESTAALLTLGADILARYRRLKESHVALDYEDLILAAGALLRRPGVAPWVLYKLDGGIDHILVDE